MCFKKDSGIYPLHAAVETGVLNNAEWKHKWLLWSSGYFSQQISLYKGGQRAARIKYSISLDSIFNQHEQSKRSS
jgi:hypothetical protein